jgi:hypothetical protein
VQQEEIYKFSINSFAKLKGSLWPATKAGRPRCMLPGKVFFTILKGERMHGFTVFELVLQFPSWHYGLGGRAMFAEVECGSRLQK